MADWRLGVPMLLWIAGYVTCLRYFVPKLRDLSPCAVRVAAVHLGRQRAGTRFIALFGKRRVDARDAGEPPIVVQQISVFKK